MERKPKEVVADIKKLKAELAEQSQILFTLSEQQDLRKKKLEKLEAELERCNKQERGITVTDHAIVRYIDRVLGINIEDIKKEITPKYIQENAEGMWDTQVPVVSNGKDCRVVIRDGHVVTITTEDK